MTGLFAAAHALRSAYGHLRTAGTPTGLATGAVSFGEFTDLVGLPEYQARARQFRVTGAPGSGSAAHYATDPTTDYLEAEDERESDHPQDM